MSASSLGVSRQGIGTATGILLLLVHGCMAVAAVAMADPVARPRPRKSNLQFFRNKRSI
jgi:hypothetical protein